MLSFNHCSHPHFYRLYTPVAETTCNLKIIGRGDCVINVKEGDVIWSGGYGCVVKLRSPSLVAAKFLRITSKGEARVCLVSSIQHILADELKVL